jgi:hypothetical protein
LLRSGQAVPAVDVREALDRARLAAHLPRLAPRDQAALAGALDAVPDMADLAADAGAGQAAVAQERVDLVAPALIEPA